jgi:hypothetical protein
LAAYNGWAVGVGDLRTDVTALEMGKDMLARTIFSILSLISVSCAIADTIGQAQAPLYFQPDKSSCEEFLKRKEITDIRDCGVTAFGSFGSVDDRLYSYVLYCIIPNYSSGVAKCGDESFSANYYSARGLGIFVQEKASRQAKLYLERGDEDLGLYVYEQPAIVKNFFGTIMHVPIRLDGTGNGNESEYYIWNEKTREWRLLDSNSWIEDLQRRIPSGLSINTGIWPDVQTMTAEAYLYREGDANCCPSGGTAIVQLTLTAGRFSIKSVEFRKDSEE